MVEIPKQCKAGMVVDEWPDFRVEVQAVDVPEISMCLLSMVSVHRRPLFFFSSYVPMALDCSTIPP